MSIPNYHFCTTPMHRTVVIAVQAIEVRHDYITKG
jgi:hypothetical protein